MAGPVPPGIGWLLAAKTVCCGALVLAVTGGGGLGTLAAWASGAGAPWVLGVGLLAAAILLWWLGGTRGLRPPVDQEIAGRRDCRRLR